ncbi:MAG: ISNCY family transposase [bacterium]
MAGKDIIMATQEEIKRLHILHKAIERTITQKEAGAILELSERQTNRLVKRIRVEGEAGIIHKLRGRASNRRIKEKIKSKILKLFEEKYHDFGPTLAAEKLFELDQLRVNDETLRLWLVEKNVPYKKRKKRPHRQWRERKHHFGEMIQIDGSHHDWFEGRGPWCVLIGYIDDATGRPFGRFYDYEGTIPALASFKSYIKEYGLPVSVYLDKHSTYKSTKKATIEEQLNDQEPLSQFGRALKELGVKVIHANSPQAKGRVERLFKTFQDRLIKEMRLKGIKTIAEANNFLKQYLPVYAKRFAVKPANDTDLHRPLPKELKLERILCIKTWRTLRNDFTIAHESRLYQIRDNVRAKKLLVEERINGSLFITHQETNLSYRVIALRPKKEPRELAVHMPKKGHIPPKDHPWRKFRLPGSINFKEKEKVLAGVL